MTRHVTRQARLNKALKLNRAASYNACLSLDLLDLTRNITLYII